MEVFTHAGGEYFDSNDKITLRIMVDDAFVGDALSVPLHALMTADELVSELKFTLAAGEDEGSLLISSACLSYHDHDEGTVM